MKYKQQIPSKVHSYRKKLWDASMLNYPKYFNKNKLISKKFLEKRNCPACNSKKYKFLLIKNGGTYVECDKCKMIFINPVFKDKFLIEYYKNNHDVKHKITQKDYLFYNHIFSKGLKLATKSFKKPGNILDIGCGNGFFLDLARKRNWKTHGLEINLLESFIAKSKGHNIQTRILKNANFNEKFDIITFWDVFEHIKDSLDLLKMCKKLLKKNGIIFMQCPSRDSIALKILQEACNMLDGIEHVNIYGKQSLMALCKKAKYKIIEYDTVISEIGVINNYLQFENPYLGSTKNVKNIFKFIDEKKMHEMKMGYKFQVCIKPI